MRHAVPAELRADQQRQHRDGWQQTPIYCPLGHTHVIPGDGEAAKLQKRLERERDRAARLLAERDQIEASLRAQKGATTKAKKRAAAAVCPCCHRSFSQLRRHMAAKHPDYDPAVEVA
jgi:hypothetical protein